MVLEGRRGGAQAKSSGQISPFFAKKGGQKSTFLSIFKGVLGVTPSLYPPLGIGSCYVMPYKERLVHCIAQQTNTSST